MKTKIKQGTEWPSTLQAPPRRAKEPPLSPPPTVHSPWPDLSPLPFHTTLLHRAQAFKGKEKKKGQMSSSALHYRLAIDSGTICLLATWIFFFCHWWIPRHSPRFNVPYRGTVNLSRWLNLLLICISASSPSSSLAFTFSEWPFSEPLLPHWAKTWLPICAIRVNQTSVRRFVHRRTCWPPSDLRNKRQGGKLQEAIYPPKATFQSFEPIRSLHRVPVFLI